jgi:hypothetical protein
MEKKTVLRADLIGDGNQGACVITDPITKAQTTQFMTKAQCDNTPGGVFIPGGLGPNAVAQVVAPVETAVKTTKKTVPKKGRGKKQ